MKNQSSYIIIILLGIVIAFSQCKVGPTYSRPEGIDSVFTYRNAEYDTLVSELQWWEIFGDSVLKDLIHQGLEQNRNLRSALGRIDELRAVTGIVKANLYPRVNYFADGKLETTNLDGPDNNSASGNGIVEASYQLDFWGRYRRLNDAAFLDYMSSIESYRGIYVTLIASIADAYLLLRDLDNRLIISQQTYEAWKEYQDIIEDRYNAGMVSKVDVDFAIIQVQDALAVIESLTRSQIQTENALSVLVGVPPRDIPRGLPLYEQTVIPELPVAIPSYLLTRRPDLRQAENQLQAQVERIGAAEALKYPQFSINASVGMSFSQNPVLGFANIGAQALGPIFNAGEIKRGIEVEEARTVQLLNNYEQTYLNAIREVEDALISIQTYRREFAIREAQMESAIEALDLSWVRYDGGMTSYLEVLELQRSKFSTQLRASETLQKQLVSMINLYIALGGGWDNVLMQETEIEN